MPLRFLVHGCEKGDITEALHGLGLLDYVRAEPSARPGNVVLSGSNIERTDEAVTWLRTVGYLVDELCDCSEDFAPPGHLVAWHSEGK